MKQQDVIINELSLDGQYKDVETFAKEGLLSLYSALNDVKSLRAVDLLKSSELLTRPVVNDNDLSTVLSTLNFQRFTTIQRFKRDVYSQLSEPFWDTRPKQDTNTKYEYKDEEVNGKSLAEAHARDAVLLSYQGGGYDENTLIIRQTDSNGGIISKNIVNVSRSNQFLENGYESGKISFKEYVRNFAWSKLDFSELDNKIGLDLIPKELESIFLSGFQKFDNLDWAIIPKDDGLNYKKFNWNKNTKDFFAIEYWNKGISKFRIDQAKRCFGYVENSVFHVLRLDLTHKLSDLG